jgi:hypothetical protein
MAASSITAKEVHELFALRKVAQKVLDRVKAHGGSYQRNSKDEVYSVRLHGQQITTEDMLCLKSMLSMTELRIENTSKIDAGAITETLGLLKQLRTLYLVDVKQLKDDSLATFKSMPTLRTLRLHSVPVTDKGLAHLKDHPYLRYVHILSCDKITDDGLSALSGLKRLYDLRLVECTKITNEGLKHLRNAPSLRNLDLRKTSIDDGVIQYLWDIENLRSVYIDKDQISADAIEVLKNKLPRCRVTTPVESTTSKRATDLKFR